MRVQVVRCPVHIFVAIWFQRTMQIIAVNSRHCWEAPGSSEVKWGNYGDIGTGTTLIGTSTHMQ